MMRSSSKPPSDPPGFRIVKAASTVANAPRCASRLGAYSLFGIVVVTVLLIALRSMLTLDNNGLGAGWEIDDGAAVSTTNSLRAGVVVGEMHTSVVVAADDDDDDDVSEGNTDPKEVEDKDENKNESKDMNENKNENESKDKNKNENENESKDMNENKNENDSKDMNKNENENENEQKSSDKAKAESGSKDETATTESKSESKSESESESTPLEDAAWKRLSSTQKTQFENYRTDEALILNVHATHHAGTSVCRRIGHHGIHGGIAPSFACMGDNGGVMPNRCSTTNDVPEPFCNSYQEMANGKRMPWNKEETGPFVEAIRPYFHFVSWEYSSAWRTIRFGRSLDSVDWDHPKLVSVVVTRDPMSRLLAGDGTIGRLYPGFNLGPGELNRTGWWDYAAAYKPHNTDNYFLRILTGEESKEYPNPTREEVANEKTRGDLLERFPTGINETHFEHGKSLLDQFTVVLDMACLTEGMEVLGHLLRLELPPLDTRHPEKDRSKNPRPAPRERIGYDDVVDFLVKKNEWDIALYEYSKTISLVRCDDL